MYVRLQQILSSILEIINYPKDKEKFITTFLQQCRQQAIINMIQSLPKDKQGELKQKLVPLQESPELGKQTIFSYFTNEQYEQVLENASLKAFEEFIREIKFTLSQAQKQKLQSYLESIKTKCITDMLS